MIAATSATNAAAPTTTPAAAKSPADRPFEFEPALKELESITAWFESTDADLDQGLAKFERGMILAAQLKEHLSAVENKIENIKLKFDAPPTAVEAPEAIEAPEIGPETAKTREPERDPERAEDQPYGLFG